MSSEGILEPQPFYSTLSLISATSAWQTVCTLFFLLMKGLFCFLGYESPRSLSQKLPKAFFCLRVIAAMLFLHYTTPTCFFSAWAHSDVSSSSKPVAHHLPPWFHQHPPAWLHFWKALWQLWPGSLCPKEMGHWPHCKCTWLIAMAGGGVCLQVNPSPLGKPTSDGAAKTCHQ